MLSLSVPQCPRTYCSEQITGSVVSKHEVRSGLCSAGRCVRSFHRTQVYKAQVSVYCLLMPLSLVSSFVRLKFCFSLSLGLQGVSE